MMRFDLDLLLGFAFEETLAVATLIFGGVLHRHPNLDICVSHGGGASAFLIGRLRHVTMVRKWLPEWLQDEVAFDGYYQRLWFDTLVHDSKSLRLLEAAAGHDRLVLGTNFAGWDQRALVEVGDLGTDISANARRLLRL
jgi:aminocarboxymuconate-semialdehyde decarboxylase